MSSLCTTPSSQPHFASRLVETEGTDDKKGFICANNDNKGKGSRQVEKEGTDNKKGFICANNDNKGKESNTDNGKSDQEQWDDIYTGGSDMCVDNEPNHEEKMNTLNLNDNIGMSGRSIKESTNLRWGERTAISSEKWGFVTFRRRPSVGRCRIRGSHIAVRQ